MKKVDVSQIMSVMGLTEEEALALVEQAQREPERFARSQEFANQIKQNRGRVVKGLQTRRLGKHIGRNDKCPCGSGKKYKRCCLDGMEYGSVAHFEKDEE